MTLPLPAPFVSDPQVQANFETIAINWFDRGANVVSGGVQLYAGATAPAGYLLCNGASYLRTTYPSLFTAIGVTYGAVDGTHFNVPDLQGRVPLGVGTATGAAGATAHTLAQKAGEETHLLLSTESGMPSHNHTQNAHNHLPASSSKFLEWDNATVTVPNTGASVATAVAATAGTALTAASNIAASAVNAAASHNTLPPYIGMNYLIKT
jgi:microcystin-dependent protein